MNNMNPWVIAALVKYDQERIRETMKQIRLEEEAMQAGRAEEKITKARFDRLRLSMWIGGILVQLKPLLAHMRKTLRSSGSTESCGG